VIVRRAGDVIPEVVRVVADRRPPDACRVQLPGRCPVCDAEVVREEEEIRFESVPGTGNADVEAAMSLDGDEDGCTLGATLIVSPRIPIPRFVPKGILEKTAGATLRTGLQHAMGNFRRELEGEA